MNDPEIEKALLKGLSPVCDYCGTNTNRLFHKSGHTVCERWNDCPEKERLEAGYNNRVRDYNTLGGPTIRFFPDGTREVRNDP